MTRPLLAPQDFRTLASRAADEAARFLEGLDGRAIFPETSGATTQALFGGDCPEQGLGPTAFDQLRDVFAHSRAHNARFLGYVLGPGEPVGAIGDFLASVINQNVTSWRSAPSAVTIERTVVSWLARAIGCEGFTGSLMGGGSAANLLGLAMAREAKAPANQHGARPGTVYASQQVHLSISKAVALLGLGRDNLRLIPVDERFRILPAELEKAIQRDVAAGLRPIAIVGCAGTVNTGAVDPLDALAELAKRYDTWLHVDGAYGALAAMTVPERFKGLDQADSLSLDGHKWLYQPVDCGCALFRDAGAARAAFSDTSDYVRVLSDDPVEGFAFFEESFELSRRFRALKVWLSLRYHGLGAFRDAIRDDLDCAEHLVARVSAHPELELLARGDLSAVCFRHRPEGASEAELDAHNAALLKRLVRRGRVYLSNARIHGHFALRACVTNFRSTREDMDAVIDEILAAARG
jgi:glutamate/tyrosine decarboxylase-like PLP-dependent enzyme